MTDSDPRKHSAQVLNLLNSLFLLGKHLSLYNEGNRLVTTTASRLHLQLDELFEELPQVTIVVARHGFIYEDEFVQRSNKQLEKLAMRMFEHGIASFTITPALDMNSLFVFLKTVTRRPSETWNEGGATASLTARKINGIAVEEMGERAFTLTEQGADTEALLGDKSDIWDRFALSLAHACGGTGETEQAASGAPGPFAATVSRLLADKTPQEKMAFSKELGRFLSSLQHEKVQVYRAQAIEKLADFINNLSRDLREMFMRNVFNLRLKADYAEGFFSQLSDEVILEALKNASLQKNYVPPVIMTLIGKLAGERKLTGAEALSKNTDDEAMSRKIQELFRADEFRKYVPSRYQKALLTVLRSTDTPEGLSSHLDELKHSLEHSGIEEHAAEITLHILRHDPDTDLLNGVQENLFSSIEHYLETRDFTSLARLCRQCMQEDDRERLATIRELLTADSFTHRLLREARRGGKSDYEPIAEIIATIGTPFIEPLLERVSEETDRQMRLFYLGCLKRLGRKVVDTAGGYLDDERWYVVRNILYLLNELNEESVLPQVRQLMKHPHPKVRQEALKLCVKLKDKAADGILLSGLESSDEEEIMNAVMLAPFSGSQRVTEKLVKLLNQSAMIDFQLDLKKTIIRTLAEIKDSAALPTFKELLAARNLLHPFAQAELKLEIVKALAKYPPAAAKPLLEGQAADGSKEVARQARQVLARMKGVPHDG